MEPQLLPRSCYYIPYTCDECEKKYEDDPLGGECPECGHQQTLWDWETSNEN